MKTALAAASAHGAKICEEKEPVLREVEPGRQVDRRPKWKEVMSISALRKEQKQ